MLTLPSLISIRNSCIFRFWKNPAKYRLKSHRLEFIPKGPPAISRKFTMFIKVSLILFLSTMSHGIARPYLHWLQLKLQRSASLQVSSPLWRNIIFLNAHAVHNREARERLNRVDDSAQQGLWTRISSCSQTRSRFAPWYVAENCSKIRTLWDRSTLPELRVENRIFSRSPS